MLILHAASSLTGSAATLADRLSAWRVQRTIEGLPAITVTETANYFRAWTSPNPDYKATIRSADGTEVGSACYAISPLNDRLYVFEIEIGADHRRHGYGTAYLKHLSETHRLPLTPIKELYSSRAFWGAARRLAGTGLQVTAQLSVSDMDAEARRWAHLEADRERLHRLIIERLYTHREPWHVATGRGLDRR